MKLTTLAHGTPDGQLYIVSRDHKRTTPAKSATTLQKALEAWDKVERSLQSQYDAINAGGSVPFERSAALAPVEDKRLCRHPRQSDF